MKKILFLLLFWITAISGFSQGALIYQDCNYRGKSQLLRPGRYNLDQIGFGAFQASSIKLYAGYKVVMYNSNEPGEGDRKIRLTTSVPCFGSDWNDKVGSIVVEVDNTNQGSGGYNPPNQQPTYPSYGNGPQVILYEDCSLRGNNRNLVPGRYNRREMGLNNDAISSLRIPSGYSVTLYKDEDFKGGSQTFYANVYCLNSSWNDQASSIVISGPGNNYNNNYTPPNNNNNNNNNYTNARDRIIVYDRCDYGGSSFGFSPGRYNDRSLGIGNDKISSIRIPNGFKVTVYQAKDFQGYSRTFYGNEYCLDGQWNDQISSMIVDGPGTNNTSNSSPSYNYGNNNAGVAVYTASYYKGTHALFNEGRHNLRNAAVSNNISSFTIQPGYYIVVYEDFEFRGRSQTFRSSVLNLNTLGWNDNIRSLVVYREY
jgi:hypothetical protein